MNKKFGNDRRNVNGAPQGGRMMMQDRKRKWEGGNEDKESKRPTLGGGMPNGNSRFSADTRGSKGYQNKPAGTGYAGFNQGQKSFGGYNREGNAGYQLRSFDKPAGSYNQKPQHSSVTTAASTPSAMTYQPAYNGYQAMSYAQYPPMSFAFPPPASSVMPPLPKN